MGLSAQPHPSLGSELRRICLNEGKQGRKRGGTMKGIQVGCLVLPGGQYRQLVEEEALGPVRT